MFAFQIATLITSFLGLFITLITVLDRPLNAIGCIVFFLSVFGLLWAGVSLVVGV